MIEAAEEEQVLTTSQSGVKAKITAGVIAEIAADIARGLEGVVARDAGAAGCRQKQRGKNAEQSGFAGSVGPKKGNCFAFLNGKRDILQGGNRGVFERLKKGAPPAPGGWEKLRERLDGDSRIGHGEVIARPEGRNNLRDSGLENGGPGQNQVAG